MKQFLRVKQFADQTFSRSGKSEISEEFKASEHKVEQMKNAVQLICKKLVQESAPEKRIKKIPEYILGSSLQDPKTIDDDCLFKHILLKCGNTEVDLANEIVDHELKVENMIYSPFNAILELDIPNINKAKKHLTKAINDRDNANNKHLSLSRQNEQSQGFQIAKVNQAKEELEEAEVKVDQAKDAWAAEIFSLLSKEMYFANNILQYLKLQRAYHESALHILTDVIPTLEKHINDSPVRPVFGFPLEEHLRVTNRTIAYPIEVCICALYELGLSEEGLLRIAAGTTRMKCMKLSLDAGVFKIPLPAEYRDVHAIAGVLKSYLRELPEPLLTYRLYDAFISAITKNSIDENRLNSLWEVIHQLPEANMNNLRYIIKFLSLLTKNQTSNKMSASNIAVVVAPNLLKASDEGITMSNTSTINCVVELLVKHADWFFKDDINFYVSFTKEELFPDLYEYGFTPNFGQGIYNQSFNPTVDPPNGDYGMSKSMFEYSASSANTFQSHDPLKTNIVVEKQTHSRSNSHDTSLILVDNEIKRTQSNSSLSDHSSPPQGSPKPIIRRKNKPIAPVPPNFVPPDKNKDQNSSKTSPQQNKDSNSNTKINKVESDKPDKPPRPNVIETIKPTSGVQTINRATYKSKQINKLGKNISSSRDNLNEIFSPDRRNSFEIEKETLKSENSEAGNTPIVNCVQSIVAQHGTVAKMVVAPESTQVSLQKNPSSIKSVTVPFKQVQPSTEPVFNIPKDSRPVAAPRTIIPTPFKPESILPFDAEPQLRPKSTIDSSGISLSGNKPTIPERPATLRPGAFKGIPQRNSSLEMLAVSSDAQNSVNSNGETLLERTHVYSVDKQQPTIIQVSSTARLSDPTVLCSDESNKSGVQRTYSTGPESQASEKNTEQKPLSSQMRKLSQSEGNILDVPPSPRLYHKPPRPQIPAPPPPTAFVSQHHPEVIESTNL